MLFSGQTFNLLQMPFIRPVFAGILTLFLASSCSTESSKEDERLYTEEVAEYLEQKDDYFLYIGADWCGGSKMTFQNSILPEFLAGKHGEQLEVVIYGKADFYQELIDSAQAEGYSINLTQVKVDWLDNQISHKIMASRLRQKITDTSDMVFKMPLFLPVRKQKSKGKASL